MNSHDDLSDRDLLRIARVAARVTPGAAATRQAIAATRHALTARPVPPRRPRRRSWMLMIGTGIAAAVASAFVLFFVVVAPQPAKAADRLEAATRASDAYRGWVHITATGVDAGGDARDVALHPNTVDGTEVTDDRFADGRRRIRMRRPATLEEITYDSTAHEIRTGTLDKTFAGHRADAVRAQPYTIHALLDGAKQAGGEVVVDTEVRDGEFDRFNLKITKIPPGQVGTLKQASAWVDPRTKLLRRVTAVIDGKTLDSRITYGEPAIHDLYDLGVPRDARVVDVRPKQNVDAVLARLDKRFAGGFGSYVAVETVYDLDATGRPKAEGSLSLRAGTAAGDALVLDTRVGPAAGADRLPRVSAPDGWPTPALRATLATMQAASPATFLVIRRGLSGWQGFASGPGSMRVTTLDGKYTQMIPSLLAQHSLPGIIWRTRTQLGLFGANATATVEPVAGRPDFVGLKIEQWTWTGKGDPDAAANTQRTESTYVIDPARDDMPVSYASRSFAPGGTTSELEFITTYTACNRLPGGAWYPTTWTQSSVNRLQAGKESRHTQTHRLQIFPGEKPEDAWFRNYARPTTVPAN